MLNKLVKRLTKKLREKLNFESNVTIQKFQPTFVTIDNNVHKGVVYNWVIKDKIPCSVSDYLMTYTNSTGYIKDEHETMYILSNIKSISWKLLDEKNVPNIYNKHQIFLTASQSKDIEFLNLNAAQTSSSRGQIMFNKNEEKIKKALEIAWEYATIDGDHHKMWVIDQMVRALCG